MKGAISRDASLERATGERASLRKVRSAAQHHKAFAGRSPEGASYVGKVSETGAKQPGSQATSTGEVPLSRITGCDQTVCGSALLRSVVNISFALIFQAATNNIPTNLSRFCCSLKDHQRHHKRRGFSEANRGGRLLNRRVKSHKTAQNTGPVWGVGSSFRTRLDLCKATGSPTVAQQSLSNN